MIKKIILIFLSVLIIFAGFLSGHYRKFLAHKIFKKTITVEEFLNIQDENSMNELYINNNGDIEYKNLLIMKPHIPITN